MTQAWTRHVDGASLAVDRPAGWCVLSGPECAFSVPDRNGSAAAPLPLRRRRLPLGEDSAGWLRRRGTWPIACRCSG